MRAKISRVCVGGLAVIVVAAGALFASSRTPVAAAEATNVAVVTSINVLVPADHPWTSVTDLSSSTVMVHASGTIYIATGPDTTSKSPNGDQKCKASATFIAPHLACWSLVGRIGEHGTPFEVGSTRFIGRASGRLYLGVNDGADSFGDNSGNWTATVTVVTLPPVPSWMELPSCILSMTGLAIGAEGAGALRVLTTAINVLSRTGNVYKFVSTLQRESLWKASVAAIQPAIYDCFDGIQATLHATAGQAGERMGRELRKLILKK
jgi:hypothetical protein